MRYLRPHRQVRTNRGMCGRSFGHDRTVVNLFRRSREPAPLARSHAYYEEIAGQLHGLLIRLDDRLPGKDLTLIAEFIDANELGLALEQMADAMSEDELPLASYERSDMLALVERMGMDDRVPRALDFCPER
jgi:hypothetical protein